MPVRWAGIITALVAGTVFLWFAASPVYRWWIFIPLGFAVVWLERKDAPVVESQPDSSTGDAGDFSLFAGVTLFTASTGFAGFLWYAALPTETWYYIPLMALAAGCFELGLPLRGPVRAVVLERRPIMFRNYSARIAVTWCCRQPWP